MTFFTKLVFSSFALFLSFNIHAQTNSKHHSGCNTTNISKFYLLSVRDLVWGNITTTEVSIHARGKRVCFQGLAESIGDGTDSTDVGFENGRVSCHQRSDKQRLAAAKLRITGYKVMGEFSGVRGKTVMLKNCSFEAE